MKMQVNLISLFMILFIFFVTNVLSQEINKRQIKGVQTSSIDTIERQKKNFYRRVLQIDSVKAEQVSQIQDSYKASLKAIIADTSLNINGRGAKIKILIDAKNQKLQQMLTPVQQKKIIPTTERDSSKIKLKQ